MVTPVVAQIDLPSKAVISGNGALTGLKISRTEVDSVFVKKVAELHNKVNFIGLICSVLGKSHLGADHHFLVKTRFRILVAISYELIRYGLEPS